MKLCVEDLSAQSRRGALRDAELRQLSMALDASLETRLLHEAGYEFDAADAWREGDDATAEAVCRRVLERLDTLPNTAPSNPLLARRGSKPFTRLAGVGTALAVAATLVGTALAMQKAGLDVGEWLWRMAAVALHSVSPPKGQEPQRAPGGGDHHADSPTISPTTSTAASCVTGKESEATLSAIERASPPPIAPAAPGSLRPSTSNAPLTDVFHPAAGDPEGAKALFAQAARERRARNFGQAITLYQTLQARYPNSPETHSASIALGMLHLGQGQAQSALTQFGRYLRRTPDGDLAPEAVFGEARALERLGRADDAIQRWRLLLERYPSSTYADAARAQLGRPQSK